MKRIYLSVMVSGLMGCQLGENHVDSNTSSVQTMTPTATSIPSVTATATSVPSVTATATSLPSVIATATSLPSITTTATSVPSVTPTATSVPSVTPTATSVPSITTTATSVPSVTPTATSVPSVTPTATSVPSVTPTATSVPSVTPTATSVPSVTPTATYVAFKMKGFNDTGVSFCSNDTGVVACPSVGFEGQDGEYGRDAQASMGVLEKTGSGVAAFDFTKLDRDGNELAANAIGHSCVRDNVTGLIWEVKTNDGGLQDRNNTYTWYNPDMSENGGYEGMQRFIGCPDGGCDTEAFPKSINNLAQPLCGFNDWRIPHIKELRSIVVYGKQNPSIDDNFFPYTISRSVSPYWSSTPDSSSSFTAWTVTFLYGGASYSHKTFGNYVRLVRSAK